MGSLTRTNSTSLGHFRLSCLEHVATTQDYEGHGQLGLVVEPAYHRHRQGFADMQRLNGVAA